MSAMCAYEMTFVVLDEHPKQLIFRDHDNLSLVVLEDGLVVFNVNRVQRRHQALSLMQDLGNLASHLSEAYTQTMGTPRERA